MQGTLVHHGIKGMHWGVRRFQNTDGSYTRAGKKRYGEIEEHTEHTVPNGAKVSISVR